MAKVVKGFDPEMQAQAEALLANATKVDPVGTVQTDAALISAQMSTSTVQKFIERSADIPKFGWDNPDLGGLASIRKWASELQQCLTDIKDPEKLKLEMESIGRSVIMSTSYGRDAAYIAHSVAETLGLPFVYLSAEEFHQTVQHWMDFKGRVVLFLEHGDWHKAPGQLAEILIRAEQFVFLTFTPNIDSMSPDLVRAKLFDRHFHIPKIPPKVQGRLWLEQLGSEYCSEDLQKNVDKVAQVAAMMDGRTAELAMLRLRRISRREARKLNVSDLIDIGIRGVTEADSAVGGYSAGISIQQIAVHEAGHAIVSILESHGTQIPLHATIMGAGDIGGFVVPTLDSELRHYSHLRLKTRVSLGGRAAEEVVFGSANISTGAAQDLRSVASFSKAYFASGVFAPGMEDAQKSGDNLLVHDDDPASQAELRAMIRPWLAEEYRAIVKLLQDNRSFLDAFAEQLQKDPVMDQQEIRALYEAHCLN